MKEWMTQVDPSKEASIVKKRMAGQYYFLQTKWYTTLKNGRQQVVFWKKYIVFTKIWCFK